MDIKEILGKNIRKLRLEKGLSLERLANEAMIDRTYLPEIEQGRRNPSIIIVERIAIALNVSISALFKTDVNDQNNKL